MRRYKIEWLLLGIMLLTLGMLIGYLLYAERSRIGASERDRLQVQARVIGENLGRQLEGVNNALVGVRENLQQWNSKNIAVAASGQLKVLSDAMPGVRAIGIFDAEGTTLASSREELIGSTVARGREFFKAPRARPDRDVLYVSPPFKSVLGVYSINVVRAVISSRGEFAGIVAATLEPGYFDVVLHSVLYAPDMLTGLVHGDGMAFLYVPANEQALGKDLAVPGSNFSRHRESGQAASMFTGPIYSTGEERMTALRTVKPADLRMDKPLIIGVSRTLSGIYASWRAGALAYCGAYTVLTLMAILGLWYFQERRRTIDRLVADHQIERQEAAGELTQSEARFRTLAQVVPVGIFRTDPSGICSYVNERYCTICGRSPEAALGTVWSTALHPDDRARVLEEWIHAVENSKCFAMEFRFQKRDGEVVWVLGRAQEERDSNGRVLGYVCSITDITERKDAEEDLRRSRELIQSVIEGTSDAVYVKDMDGRYTLFNSAAAHFVGKSVGEVIGRDDTFLFPHDEAKVVMAGDHTVITSGTTQTYEEIVTTASGEVVTFLSTKGPLVDGKGNIFGLFGVSRDITERKRAEDALRDSDARFRTLVEQAGDGFHLVDEQGRFLDVNNAACMQVGYSRQELLQLEIFDIAPKLSREEYASDFKSLLNHSPVTFESVQRRKDGTIFPVEGTRSIVQIGSRWQSLTLVRDISERRRLEEAHLQAHKLESLGTLAGGIAHDFNNILVAIRGNANLAAEDVGPDHPAAQSLEEIRKAGTRASELVRRIMAFGRPRDTQHEAVELGAVTDEVLKLLRSTLPAGIALNRNFVRDTPPVLADAGQIHEAIVNLTTNAAQAIGARAGTITYRLEPVQVDEKLARSIPGLKAARYARLTVSDSGCGMDAGTMERIFDAFYTTKEMGEGTGLGLSMVHGIMKSHDGAVTVQSTPGKGSSFALYFPAAKEKVKKEEQGARVQDLPATGQRVLYVDDEEALVFLAKRVLSRLGHSISGFTDPKEALEAFRAHPQEYDIMVTDLSMPQMSGFELSREVLAVRPGIPILMTSGYIEAEDEHRARKAGIRELILKPVTMDELGQVLDTMFRDGELNTRPSAQTENVMRESGRGAESPMRTLRSRIEPD